MDNFECFSKKDFAVVALLSKGLSDKQIARFFKVSPKTIYWRLENIRKK